MQADLKALIERVESGAGSDIELDGDVWCEVFAPDAVTVDFGVQFPPYTASLDAVLSLIEVKLPGWRWLRKHPATMSVYKPPESGKEWAHHVDGYSIDPARALLAAALRAIQESRHD